jgi:hypothetical protein
MSTISVLPRQNLVPELCRNVKSHMLELRYEVLQRKHRYDAKKSKKILQKLLSIITSLAGTKFNVPYDSDRGHLDASLLCPYFCPVEYVDTRRRDCVPVANTRLLILMLCPLGIATTTHWCWLRQWERRSRAVARCRACSQIEEAAKLGTIIAR